MRRDAAIVLFMALVCSAWATPEIMKSLHEAAGVKASSKLAAMKCMLCHAPNPPTRQAFGKDVEHEIESVEPELMTAALWADLSQKDSDGDGVSNGDEVLADTKPGDATEKPVPSKADAQPTELESQPVETTTANGPIPKHSFHPLFVHFPIALILFGVALECFGFRKRDSGMRHAGWLGLLWGTILAAPTLLSGLRAFFQLEMRWEGDMLIHAILAVTGILCSTCAVLWRRKGEIEAPSYFALLILSAIAVGGAGHFGAMMVFG